VTAPLEIRYRRLLAVYPAAHRRAYGEEMVAVLMAGAEPGQRRPAPAEVVDLLRAGLVARLGRGVQGLRTSAWRGAAAVAALIGAVLLAAVPGRRLLFALLYTRHSGDPMRFLGIDGGLLIDVAARSGAWLAVVVAVLLAARRTAVVLGVVALLVELAAIAVWSPDQQFRAVEMAWVLVLAPLTVALLVHSRRGRTAVATVGRRGLTPIVAGLLVAAVATVLLRFWQLPPQLLGLITVPDALFLAAGALLAAGLRGIGPAVRGRILVLLAPVLALPAAQQFLEQAVGIHSTAAVTPGIVALAVLVMAGVPAVALALAAAVLHLFDTTRITVTRVTGSPSV
jgi:hypothetical protein